MHSECILYILDVHSLRMKPMPHSYWHALPRKLTVAPIPSALQESWQFGSCPHVTSHTSHSCCSLSSPGMEQCGASPKPSSTCAPKIKIIALCVHVCVCEREGVNISFHKYCESHLRQRSDNHSHPEAMSQHSDNLPCLCNDPLLHHPRTLLLGVSKLACCVPVCSSCIDSLVMFVIYTPVVPQDGM